MKVLKKIGQILASIIYTCLYTGVLYFIVMLPMVWIMSLDTKIMVLVLLLLGGVITAIQGFLGLILVYPYRWFCKENKAALIISIVLVIINLTINDVMIWRIVGSGGVSGITFGIIVTILFATAAFWAVSGIIGLSSEL